MEHYPNAACRHLIDSQHLLNVSRWDGCAYLAGYVIECSLKALIAHPSIPSEIDLHAIGHDLSKLTHTLDQMAASRKPEWKRHASSSFLLALRNKLDSQQLEWHPRMRYESSRPEWQSNAKDWWNLANRCFNSFAKTLVTEGAS